MERGTHQSGIGGGGRVLRAIGPACVAGVALGWGGPAGDARAEQPGLRRIHQLVADLDPLSVSLLNLEPDLRQDVGFQHLYVEDANPDRFVRISGAMYAVSPRTDYYQTRDEIYAVVSPGTVFYIGEPPELAAATAPATREGRGVSESVSATMRAPVRAAEIVTTAPMAVFASDVETSGVRRVTPEAPTDTGSRERATPADRAPGAAPTPRKANDMADASFRAARLRQIARRLSSW